MSQMMGTTFQVFASCADGAGSGSAVSLGNHEGLAYFATAAHVVDGENCGVQIASREVEVVETDATYDIAILRARAPFFFVTAVEMAPVYLGMPIVAMGYPLQPFTGKTELQVTSGVMSALIPLHYKISSPVYFGNSGGHVYDEQGRLVGLVVSLIQKNGVPMPGEWFATPGWRVFEMYDEALQ